MQQIVELQPDEPIDADIWQQYLHDKREVFRFLLKRDANIKNIGEIGIRSGYGARMFMDNIEYENAEYYGFDNCISIVGRSGMAWFSKLTKNYFAHSYLLDTQKIKSFKEYFDHDFKNFFDFCSTEESFISLRQ